MNRKPFFSEQDFVNRKLPKIKKIPPRFEQDFVAFVDERGGLDKDEEALGKIVKGFMNRKKIGWVTRQAAIEQYKELKSATA